MTIGSTNNSHSIFLSPKLEFWPPWSVRDKKTDLRAWMCWGLLLSVCHPGVPPADSVIVAAMVSPRRPAAFFCFAAVFVSWGGLIPSLPHPQHGGDPKGHTASAPGCAGVLLLSACHPGVPTADSVYVAAMF